jgi:hypothetical protein
MKIKLLDFFLEEDNKERGYISGTLKVNLPDQGINILGVYVKKLKDKVYVLLPGRNIKDQKTEKVTRYPFISFDDREIQKKLIYEIRCKAVAFIEKKLSEDKEKVIPEKKPIVSKEAKKITLPKGEVIIQNKIWKDPPKLNTKRKFKK